MEMNSVDEFFASIEEECVSTIHPLQLTPEEQESTKQNLYCCLLEKLSFNLFACLEKETGVGLFDLKSIITSINIINIDYLLLVCSDNYHYELNQRLNFNNFVDYMPFLCRKCGPSSIGNVPGWIH